MDDIPEDWLEQFNRRMREEQIPYFRRPFLAISEWTRIHNSSIVFPSATASKVFKWFQERSAKGSHAVGPMFTGAFYFDSYFWPVHIPIAYGTVPLDPLDFLDGMPDSVKGNLSANQQTLVEYLLLWTDCLDYCYGLDDIRKTGKCTRFGSELVVSADRELRATVELLTQRRHPNPKAMENARMSTEMFLKAYLVVHGDLEAKKAKELGHDLSSAAAQCLAIGRNREF